MTDWASAAAMIAAGVILGAMFIFTMKRRKENSESQLQDLEAKRDALLQRLREVDLPGEEKRRLELETAGVLRQIDQRAPARRAEPAAARAERRAQMTGFAWGVGSVLVIVGLFWFVTQKAAPKSEGSMQQQSTAAPMQQPQAAQQSDPEVKG